MKPMRLVLALPLALALAGCSILGSEQRDPVTIFAPDVRVPARPDWPAVSWTLVIAKPTAARVIDSPRISVRPMPGELQVYRGVSWALPATDMLQDAVQRTLEDSGRIPAVASADAGILGDYKLVMDVRRFEADYAGAALPSAVVSSSITILNPKFGSVTSISKAGVLNHLPGFQKASEKSAHASKNSRNQGVAKCEGDASAIPNGIE